MLAILDRVLAPVTWFAAGFAVLVLFVGPELIGAKKEEEAPAAEAAAPAADGQAVFESAGCGGCHTLAAAGSTGAVGPNLDQLQPDAAAVAAVVRSGAGTMPSFEGRLSDDEIAAVAAFVAGDEAPPAEETPAGGETAVAATIRAGRGPDGITVSDDGDVWVTDARAGTLLQIDPQSDALTGEPIPAGGQPDSPAADGGVVWVAASGDDAVLRIEDGESRTIGVGRQPESLALGERLVWVANAGDGTVTRIDRATGEVAGEPIEVGERPLDIAVGPRAIWVTSFEEGTVTRLDPATGEVIGEPTRVGRGPRGVAVGDRAVWVANASDDTVSRVDPATGEVMGEPIPVGGNPRELAVGDGAVWVANSRDSTVTRIDAATGEVDGEPIEVGEDPIGIAVGVGAVWTADYRAGTVTRIRPGA